MTLFVPSTSLGTTTDLAARARGLTRRYGNGRALNGLDLDVPWDQCLAIVGANGAGKTTLLRILATLTRPSAGSVSIGGLDLPGEAAAIRQHVGLVAHQTFLYDDLTTRENLVFYGRLYGLAQPGKRADVLLERVGLAERAGDRVRSLSRGLQQRAALARAVVHDPPILLLDEPDTGLDTRADTVLGAMMTDERGHARTVLLTTHNLERARELSQRIIVLSAGRVARDVASGATTSAELAAAIRDAERRADARL